MLFQGNIYTEMLLVHIHCTVGSPQVTAVSVQYGVLTLRRLAHGAVTWFYSAYIAVSTIPIVIMIFQFTVFFGLQHTVGNGTPHHKLGTACPF